MLAFVCDSRTITLVRNPGTMRRRLLLSFIIALVYDPWTMLVTFAFVRDSRSVLLPFVPDRRPMMHAFVPYMRAFITNMSSLFSLVTNVWPMMIFRQISRRECTAFFRRE